MTPTFGASYAGTTLVHGSVPATLINLSGRALARGSPASVTSPGPQCPHHSLGATNGQLAIIMATLAFLVLIYRNLLRSIAGGTTGTLSLSFMQSACALKGGLLSIATQELLLALQPSPLALSTASRPGIPAGAELARGSGPEDVEREVECGEERGSSRGPNLATSQLPTYKSGATRRNDSTLPR